MTKAKVSWRVENAPLISYVDRSYYRCVESSHNSSVWGTGIEATFHSHRLLKYFRLFVILQRDYTNTYAPAAPPAKRKQQQQWPHRHRHHSSLDADAKSTTIACVSCLDAWAVFVFVITDKSSINLL